MSLYLVFSNGPSGSRTLDLEIKRTILGWNRLEHNGI